MTLASPPAVLISVGRRKAKSAIMPDAEQAVEVILRLAGFELSIGHAGLTIPFPTLWHVGSQLHYTVWCELSFLQVPGVALNPGWAQRRKFFSSAVEIATTPDLLMWLVKRGFCKTGYHGYNGKATLVSVEQVQENFARSL